VVPARQRREPDAMITGVRLAVIVLVADDCLRDAGRIRKRGAKVSRPILTTEVATVGALD